MKRSPDGRRVAFAWECEILAMGTDGSGLTHLVRSGPDTGCNAWPRWSPDGTLVAFATNREGRALGHTGGLYDAYVMNADGSNPRNVSHALGEDLGFNLHVAGWSPGGQVVFMTDGPTGGQDTRVYLVNPDGTGLRPLFDRTGDHSPAWSPDGSQIAFISERDGPRRLYIMNADGSDVRPLTNHPGQDWLSTTRGGFSSMEFHFDPWSPDGSRIAFARFAGGDEWGTLHTVRPDGTQFASGMGQRHDHRFGAARERDLHTTGFGEVAITGTDRGHTWVVGAALQHESYHARDVTGFDYRHITPSLFVQDEVSPTGWLTIAASGRVDVHSEFGAVFNPRVSVLLRPDSEWTVRASAGTGYFAPTPFTEETEVLGLSRVEPLHGLRVERARSGSLDLGRTVGHVELNGTLFGSEVDDPVMVRRIGDGRVEIFNASEPTRTWGTDLLARFHEEPFHLVATYTYTRSTELDDNPYRDQSRPYLIFGVLVERRVGSARVFLNAENLLDARQTRSDPLLLPARSPEGRWTTDAWAPLEGRTFNAGVRLEF